MSQQLPQIGEIIFSATVGGVEVKAQVVEESELGYAVTLTVGDWTAPDEDPYDFGLWFDGFGCAGVFRRHRWRWTRRTLSPAPQVRSLPHCLPSIQVDGNGAQLPG